MRSLSSTLTQSVLLSSLLLGLSDAQACPGICINDGEALLNPAKPIFLNSGIQFCATLNDVSRQIENDQGACRDAAIQAEALGCECGIPPQPTQAPTVAPVVPGMPVANPAEESCLGICPGGTLTSPNKIVTITGQNPDFCFAIDNTLKKIVGNPTQCDTLSIGARAAGCECEGVPTSTPTMNPTITRSPTPRPSMRPTGTPTGSPRPTRTDSPTKVPTTPNPTGSPTTPKPTAAPAFCSGVCQDPNQVLADPDFVIFVSNAIGGGVITETCAEADARYKQIYAPGGTCERFSRTAQNAGCSCTEAVDCPGICNSGQVTAKIGLEIVTPNLVVEIDGRSDTCANFDARWDATTSPLLCANVPAKISAALAAGCRCDVPIDCDGLCPGEEVTTPNLEVELSNGYRATCAQMNAEFDNTIDPQRCNEYIPFRSEAMDLGCRCGTPITCDGLCPNANEVLLTPDMVVDLPDGEVATCETLDLQVRELIDEGLCSDGIAEALAAGCRCGEPIKCPGICPNKDRKLFDKKAKIIVPWTGREQECDKVDKEIKDTIIDEIICLERSVEANKAGCQCGPTSESPSMAPSLSFAPTMTASASPTGVPTVAPPPTFAPNVPLPLNPTVIIGGNPTNGEPTSDGGDGGGGASESGSVSFKKQVMLTMSMMVAIFYAL